MDGIPDKYYEVSAQLGEDFFAELQVALKKVAATPRFFHFDQSGLRRCNLERFPYHFLFDIRDSSVRVWVLRYDGRDPKCGLRRFNK